MQTNSPHNRVNTALGSAHKSKLVGRWSGRQFRLFTDAFSQLARRLYYSFKKEGVDYVTIGDIAR